MSRGFHPDIVGDLLPHIEGDRDFVVNPFTGKEVGELELVLDADSCDPYKPHEIDDAYKIEVLDETTEDGGTHKLHILVPHPSADLSTRDPMLSEAIVNGPSTYPNEGTGLYVPMLREQESVARLRRGHFARENDPVVATDLSMDIRIAPEEPARLIDGSESFDLVIANVARNLTYREMRNENRAYRREKKRAHPLELAAAALLNEMIGYEEKTVSRVRETKSIVSIFMNYKNTFIANEVGELWLWPFRACDQKTSAVALSELQNPAQFFAEEYSSSKNRSNLAGRAYFTLDPNKNHAYFERRYCRETSPFRRPEDMLAHFLLTYLFKGGDPQEIDRDAMEAIIMQINRSYEIPEPVYMPVAA